MIVHSLTPIPPCQIRAENRRARNTETWNDPEYQAREKEYLAAHPSCIYCGEPSEVAHHTRLEVYGRRAYYDLEQYTIPLCRHCHHGLHHGLKRCPECGGWMWPGQERCSKCESDEVKTARKIRKLRLNRARNQQQQKRYRDAKGGRK